MMKNKIAKRMLKIELSPVEEASRLAYRSNVINLASGNPDPRVIPAKELREIIDKVLRERGVDPFMYPEAGGQEDLKSEIRNYMKSLNISLKGDEEIVITSGAQHALRMIADTFIESKTQMFVENPTFYEALMPFKMHSASITGINIDEKGLKVDELEYHLTHKGKTSCLIYLIPTCQNPTGTIMSLDRRKWILEIASKYDLLIIEDDPYRPIAIDTPPPIKKFDNEGRVLYVGSFSKILAPGLRVGWVCGPKFIIEKLTLLEQLDFAISTLMQYTVLEALRSGLVSKLMKKLTNHYKFKMKVMNEALEEFMPNNVKWIKASHGFFLLAQVKGKDMEKLLPKAIKNGVIYVPARKFYINKGDPGAVRLSITSPKENEIKNGIKRLASVLT